jgi:hypothetical protein
VKSTRSYLVLFFALTTVGTLVLAYKQYVEIVTLRAQLSDPTAGLQKQLADAQSQVRQLRAELDAAKTRSRPGAAAETAADEPGRNFRARQQTMGANIQKLFNDPTFLKLSAIEQKAQLDFRYAALFKELNLSAAQVDQLKNLLVQKQQAQSDALQAARDQGMNFRNDPQALRQAVSDAQASIDDQIKSTLGDAGFAQYQQYDQTGLERNVVNRLQQSLSYTAAPLTDDQSRQLVQILAQNQSAGTAGSGAAALPGGAGPAPAITDQILSQAAGLLSPAQLQALQQVQAQQQAEQQMQQLIRAAQGRTPGTPGGG